jgi:hypothetical protein
MSFFLGTHQPSWLARDLGVPLLVSHQRLADRRTLPRATGSMQMNQDVSHVTLATRRCPSEAAVSTEWLGVGEFDTSRPGSVS